MIREALLVALLLLLLAACGTKKQIPFDPGQMHELNLPRQANAGPSATERDAAKPPSTAQPSPSAPSAAAPSTAASQTAPSAPAAAPASAAAAPASAAALSLPAPTLETTTPAPSWPLTLSQEGVVFQVHEPLAEAWQDGILTARSLVIAQPTDAQPVYGSVLIKAVTEVDSAARIVRLQDVEVKGTDFSAAPNLTQGWQEYLRFALPPKVRTISLARLEAGQSSAKAPAPGSPGTEVSVPRIIVSEKPALLVFIDGDPRYVPVQGTDLSGVLNTRALLLKDASGAFYLHVYDGWVSSESLEGPWNVASPPAGAEQAERAARATGRVNLLPGKADAEGRRPGLASAPLPEIIVTYEPTALINVDGEPRFAAIPGTSLRYATNTSAHLFEDESNAVYARVGGNWFRASALTQPWQYVPIGSLPAGFAAIPNDHPKSAVKASVASAHAPSAPAAWTVSAADPSTARLNYTMNGDPDLRPIKGTQLNYVANASVPIIQVDINNWYAVQNGVWFRASEVTGPWSVTDQVPPQIYAVPPTSPIYHAIHSRVIASSSDVVYYGYPTPGSLGPEGGAMGVEDQGADYQYTPPSNLYWGWFY